MITLSISKLKDILQEAYEAGWFGSLECKEDIVSQIIDRNFPPSNQISTEIDQIQLGLSCTDTILVGGNFSTTTTEVYDL